MAYQISKDICSMAAALEGHINAVVLTGNLCRAKTLVKEIKKRISFFGKVMLYPGEDELESLALGGYLVLTQAEKIKEYS
jgi:butyrate kinase